MSSLGRVLRPCYIRTPGLIKTCGKMSVDNNQNNIKCIKFIDEDEEDQIRVKQDWEEKMIKMCDDWLKHRSQYIHCNPPWIKIKD